MNFLQYQRSEDSSYDHSEDLIRRNRSETSLSERHDSNESLQSIEEVVQPVLEDDIYIGDEKIAFPSTWNVENTRIVNNSIEHNGNYPENHVLTREHTEHGLFQTTKKSPIIVRLHNTFDEDNESIEASFIENNGSFYSSSSSHSHLKCIREVSCEALPPLQTDFDNNNNEWENAFATTSTCESENELIIEYDLKHSLSADDNTNILDGVIDKTSRQEILELEDSLELIEANFRQMLEGEDFTATTRSMNFPKSMKESVKWKYHPTNQQLNESLLGHVDKDRNKTYPKLSNVPFDEHFDRKSTCNSVQVPKHSDFAVNTGIVKEKIVSPTEKISMEKLTDSIQPMEPAETNNTLQHFCLHARSTEDNVWYEALNNLSMDLTLATFIESGSTPLHTACMREYPPPQFFIHGLILAFSDAVRIPDEDGQLPLHFIAAKSADAGIMQLLINEYPESIVTYNKEGLLPLHKLLKNMMQPLNIEQLRLLLGQANTEKHAWRDASDFKPGTALIGKSKHTNDHAWIKTAYENIENKLYSENIKSCLKRILRKKKKQKRFDSQNQDDLIQKSKNIALNAASLSAPFSQLALHLAVCRNSRLVGQNRDRDSENLCDLLRVLVQAYPTALVTLDEEGRTPLLISMSCQNNLPNGKIVEILLGNTSVGFERLPEWTRGVDIHNTRKSHLQNPAMIATRRLEQLPLHIAAQQMTSREDILLAIYEAYPGAIQVQDIRGRTPLHLALRNFQNIHLNPKVLALLLTSRVAQTADDEDMIPFEVFVENASVLPRSKTGLNSPSSAAAYERFFELSILPRKSTSIIEANAVLDMLLKLPAWIRNYAFSAEFVQDTVHNMRVEAPKVALIMFNGLILGLLLILIRLELNSFPSTQNIEFGVAICCISLYLLFYQLLYCFAAIKISTFLSQCLGNIIFWVDVASPLLAMTTVAVMANGNIESVASLGTATTGLLWASIIGFFAKWWHGMAVFVGGVFRLGELLIWPFITAVAFTIGLAQMFLTLSLDDASGNCKSMLGSRPLCDIWDSYVSVYLLFNRIPLIDTIESGNEDMSFSVIILVAFSSLMLILFILNTIIIVVLRIIQVKGVTEASLRYWEAHLVYLVLFNIISSCISGCDKRWLNRWNVQCGTMEKHVASRLGNIWDTCMSILFDMPQSETAFFFASDVLRKPGMKVLFSSLILLFIPIWIFAGIITLGILLPPQVRGWLFRPTRGSKSPGRNTLGSESRQFALLENQLQQVKDMCYGEIQQVHEEILELRQMLVSTLSKSTATNSWDASNPY